jgi:hypothetical protein
MTHCTRLLVLPFTVLLAACGGSSIAEDEVTRMRSPDGRLEASLVETNGGATTSFGYRVRLRARPEGAWTEVGYFYGARRSQCAYGINLRWAGPRRLQMEFLEAQNARIVRSVRVGQEQVTMEARKGMEDQDAPCGGMDYNRRGRPYG